MYIGRSLRIPIEAYRRSLTKQRKIEIEVKDDITETDTFIRERHKPRERAISRAGPYQIRRTSASERLRKLLRRNVVKKEHNIDLDGGERKYLRQIPI